MALIEYMAVHADISKASAARALEGLIQAVQNTLSQGDAVSIVGFGTFAVARHAPRVGRNPRTGVVINIKETKVPKFKPGKNLKDAVE